MNKKKAEARIIKKLYKGSMLVLILAFATATISMLIDSIIVGQFLGAKSVAALGLCSPLFLITSALGGALSEGTQPVCNKLMASGRKVEANKAFSLSVLLIIIISIVISILLLICSSQVSSILGADAELFNDTYYYVKGYALCIPAVMAALLFTPFAQADGDQKSTVIAILVMTVLNIIFDLLTVSVFKTGMFGIAMSTTLSYYIGLVFLILHFFKKSASYHFNFLKIDFTFLKDIVITGLPSVIGKITLPFRTIALNHLLLIVGGSIYITAFSVQNTISTLSVSASIGIGAATLMLASILYGEEDKKGLTILLGHGFKMSFLCNGIIALIIFIFASPITGLIINSADPSFETTRFAVRVYALILFFDSPNGIFSNYLQAIGKIAIATVLNVLNCFLCTTAFAFLLTPHFGGEGVWYAFLAGEITVTIITMILAWINKKKISLKTEDFLFVGNNFGVPAEDEISGSFTNKDDIVNFSMESANFCRNHLADEKTVQAISLAIEEMAVNIFEHGFSEKQISDKQATIDIRLVKKGEKYIIRLRDDAMIFNAADYADMISQKDEAFEKDLGFKLITGTGSKLEYICTMNTNNLIITYVPKSA
ncbi:MAG: hypothetical protein E7242_04855 [Lachnospiraceae bacterium]|nr:hypothetical protein [Lachnospiraceae bacterium]